MSFSFSFTQIYYHFLQECVKDGANLASIHSTTENAAIMTEVLQRNENIWIGFRDADVCILQ